MKKKLPPGPTPTPPGYVWHYSTLVPERDVEHHAQREMRAFDKLPPIVCFAINEATIYTDDKEAKRLIKLLGEKGAAEAILARTYDDD